MQQEQEIEQVTQQATQQATQSAIEPRASRTGRRSSGPRRGRSGLRRGALRWLLTLLVGLLCLGPFPSGAALNPTPNLASSAASQDPFCDLDRLQYQPELDALVDRIYAAESIEEARQIATNDTKLAYDVLERARFFAPGNETLQVASLRLDHYHASIAQASTSHEIVASLGSLTTSADVDLACDYTTAEVLIILLGLLLGIIPGLILLILLC